ncbi:MAG TPA: ABC transporter permease [Streptosporangiaceae bacterium]|nr:ABC transporter permease [Streptosporangiaceae bacterium]
MTSAITAAGLRKSFGGKTVLAGIDLEVGAGTTFSLLGPNGAGKTTTVQIMATLVRADGGEVRVAGHDVAADPAAVRAAIGVTGQFSAVDNLLTGEENLLLMADLHHLGRAEGRRRAARLLDTFGRRARRGGPGPRRRVPARGHADAGGAQRRRRGRGAGAAEPARRVRGRGRRGVRAHPRSRRRVLRPHRAPGRRDDARDGGRAMTTMALAVRDSATMTRRSLRHVLRYPVTLVVAVVVPVLVLLLFIGVFGALKTSLGAGAHVSYIDYVLPGIIVMTAGYGSSVTAQSVNRDATEGIIARFRTMAISPASVLHGHVATALARTLVSVALVIGVAIGLGFRAGAGAGRWLAAAGVTVLLVLALSWLAVSVGLAAKAVEGTTGFILIVQVLPFISSAFVPPGQMSGSVRWFAAHEPFTPVIDTLRGLLAGTPSGGTVLAAVAWCAGLALAGYLWARVLFRRDLNR